VLCILTEVLINEYRIVSYRSILSRYCATIRRCDSAFSLITTAVYASSAKAHYLHTALRGLQQQQQQQLT